MELLRRYSKHDATGVSLDRLVAELVARLPGQGRTRESPHRLRHKLDQRLGAETVALLAECYNAGIPTTQLMLKYGLGKGSVLRLLSDVGTVMRRRAMTEAQIEEAVALYESGQSLAQVGAQLGVHSSTVWRALRAKRITMRSPNAKRRHLGGDPG